ncbi:heparan sulfate glucosamine 3-O-sulfotransferase 5-like isoform X1 [Centruroides sculpturatus]|uniref:heparan sulfate glucosamine 3-O-sulfotransferase 5-like isoform X1 n=2 Tax=Centruroides sculpturatus TaxID=218467 RepID=UPI000C6CD071|nr:heparan sulfate glucosamine 3-O-sulfotransferase 5-like isoform X1 [Centruroides sculpturatus]
MRWAEANMTTTREVTPLSWSYSTYSPHTRIPTCAASTPKKNCYLTKGKLFAAFFILFFTSFLIALRIVYAGYFPNAPIICVTSYNQASDIPSDSRDHVRFPRTKRRLPQCIIIGVRKGGTRALLEFLNIHPAIQKATDEVHFFDDDSKYQLGLEWYRRKMPYSFPDQITLEKSPAYFITESVPWRIHSMNETIKLLLIVRDPVTRLISDYAQLAANKARRDRSIASFEDLVIQSDGSINTSYKAVRISMYSIYFRRWLELFSRNQIHVVDGDLLIKDPYLEMRKIEEFLGINHRITRDHFVFNKTKGFYCVRNETADKCLNDSKGRKHPEISNEIIHKLRRFYAPYNHDFYRTSGTQFNWPEK